MKTCVLCTIVMVVLFVTGGIAQDERVDVVYLMDGSVIRGTIIEQIPNKSLKIETQDGSVFVIEYSRIQKITKEKPRSSQGTGGSSGTSGSSDTKMVTSLLMGGMVYVDFFFATGARIGASIAGIAYAGIVVTTAFSDVTAVYFGGDLGFNLNVEKITVQPYISLGLGSVSGRSAFCLGPGFAFTYWATKEVGIGPDVKYMFVPDAEDSFGLIHLSLTYRF
jgi:hypothetical protein